MRDIRQEGDEKGRGGDGMEWNNTENEIGTQIFFDVSRAGFLCSYIGDW